MVASKTSFIIAAVTLGATSSVYAAPTPFNAGDLATRGFEPLETRFFNDDEDLFPRASHDNNHKGHSKGHDSQPANPTNPKSTQGSKFHEHLPEHHSNSATNPKSTHGSKFHEHFDEHHSKSATNPKSTHGSKFHENFDEHHSKANKRDVEDMVILARSLGLADTYFLEERSFDDEMFDSKY